MDNPSMGIAKGQGLWVPVHKGFREFLPKNRKYTEMEAAFSVQLDFTEDNTVTVAGYASQWGWSRDKVKGFLARHGAVVLRMEDTGSLQNQRGRLQIPVQMSDRYPTDTRQINFINNRCLEDGENRYPADNQQIPDRSPVTTIESLKVKTKKEEKTLSSSFDEADNGDHEFYATAKKRRLSGDRLRTFNEFMEAFKDKRGRAQAADAWLDIQPFTAEIHDSILKGAASYAADRPELVTEGKTPKMAQGWITAKRWEDEIFTGSKVGTGVRDIWAGVR
jgi:hypothetical protein